MLAGTGLDEIYAQINSSGTTSFLRDGLNSTVALTNLEVRDHRQLCLLSLW